MVIVSERPPVLQNQTQNTQAAEAAPEAAASRHLYEPHGTAGNIKQHLPEEHRSFPKGYYVAIIICIKRANVFSDLSDEKKQKLEAGISVCVLIPANKSMLVLQMKIQLCEGVFVSTPGKDSQLLLEASHW